jgi:hypothetical protein
MPRRSYLIFGDNEGKLDVLRVECTKCARLGRYSVRRLIEKYGRKANMMKWKEQLTEFLIASKTRQASVKLSSTMMTKTGLFAFFTTSWTS